MMIACAMLNFVDGTGGVADPPRGRCETVQISGHQGDFAPYVNGLYVAALEGGRPALVNGRSSYQKERGLETAEQPELFLMFRDDRWFITFFVPGQGKTMSGLGYFLEDVVAADELSGPLYVAGKADPEVRVACKSRAEPGEGINDTTMLPPKPFPAHWGSPPLSVEEGSFAVDLGGGYGRGSSMLQKWVEERMLTDSIAEGATRAPNCMAADGSTAASTLPQRRDEL